MKDKKSQIRRMAYGSVFLSNLICLILGISYVQMKNEFMLIGIYGIFMLITFFINVIYNNKEDKQIWLNYCYLIIHCLWMVLLPLINTIFSLFSAFSNTQSLLSIGMLFSLFILGGYLSILGLTQSRALPARDTVVDSKIVEEYQWVRVNGRLSITMKNVIIVLLCILLFSGIFLNYMILRSRSNGIMEAFTSGYGLFYGYFFFGMGNLLLKVL